MNKTLIRSVWVGLFALVLSSQLVSSADFRPWSKKISLTFSGYTKSETLTNFPVLVVLSTNIGGFSYADFQSGTHNDLRFTDGAQTNELNYEVEKWDTNGSSYVWVQIPSLAQNTVIWALWGMAGQAVPAYTTNGSTWSEGYIGVWHMNQVNAIDSTANHLDGTASGGVTLRSDGPVGAALAFNGSSGYVSIPNQALLNPAQITVETWAEFTGPVVDLWTMLVAKGYDGNCPYNLLLAQGRGAGAIGFGGWVTSETIAASPAGTVATAERHYLAGTCDPTYYNIYTDGILRGSTSGPGSLPSNGTPLGFGASSSWYGGPCFYFNGTLDEIRLSSVPRSSNWVWACWMNVASNSSFVTAAPASAGFSTAAPQGPIYRFW